MNEENKKITRAFALMYMADGMLERAMKLLAEFEMDVPDLNAKVLEMMGDSTNSIEKSNQFIRSFIRMSLLQQIVKVKPQETTTQ